MKRAGARKKKNTRFGGGDDLAVDEPAGTAALPPSPVSPDAVTIDAPTPKAAAPPVFGRHQSTTEWTSGLGAVRMTVPSPLGHPPVVEAVVEAVWPWVWASRVATCGTTSSALPQQLSSALISLRSAVDVPKMTWLVGLGLG